MFITAQLVFLEANSVSIAFANAGHCPPIAISGDGTARTLDEGGLPLGVSQEEHYLAWRTTLQPQERLLLVTDGILEAPDANGREFGLEGVIEASRHFRTESLDTLCAGILTQLEQRDPTHSATDDRTLLAIQSHS